MFRRPVDHVYPIKAFYGQKEPHYTWSIDPDNGFWIPVRGKDNLGQHRGTDFDCPVGTAVRAMAAGVILRARFESAIDIEEGAGLHILQLVSLVGFDNWVIRYSHLKSVFVKPGDPVERGAILGESGKTGDVTSPYLHVDLVDVRRQWKAIPLEA